MIGWHYLGYFYSFNAWPLGNLCNWKCQSLSSIRIKFSYPRTFSHGLVGHLFARDWGHLEVAFAWDCWKAHLVPSGFEPLTMSAPGSEHHHYVVSPVVHLSTICKTSFFIRILDLLWNMTLKWLVVEHVAFSLLDLELCFTQIYRKQCTSRKEKHSTYHIY